MKTIITIQHTQSIHHTNGMVGSWTDWDLSELGVQQAKRIGEKLNVEFGDYIYKARSMGSECKLEMENIIEAFKALCKKYKVNFDDYMGVFFRQLSP